MWDYRPDVASDLTLHDVAERLGVHYMTVHRYVREGRLPARKVKGRWAVTDDDLAAFSERGRPADGGDADRPGAAVATVELDDLVAGLIAGDDERSWATALDLASAPLPDEVIADALVPAMAEIGARWERDEVGVDDEHRATATATRLVGRLADLGERRGRRSGQVVIGAPEGDDHSLPVTLGAALARRERFVVTELGPDVSPATFADAASEVVADGADPSRLIVVIVVTCDRGRAGAGAAAEAVAAAVPGATILVGGGAVADEADARSLGATAWGADLRAALLSARR